MVEITAIEKFKKFFGTEPQVVASLPEELNLSATTPIITAVL